MKKRIAIFAVAAMLALSGCDEQAAPTSPTYTAPTLPDFDQELTPEQHLNAAMEQLEALDSFSVSYGSGWKDDLTLTTGSGEEAYAALRQLVPNEDLIAQFSAGGMMVSPSNTGSFLYQSGTLTLEETCQLICGRAPTEEELAAVSGYSEVIGTIRIGLDADLIFQSLQVDITLDDTLWTLQITIQR